MTINARGFIYAGLGVVVFAVLIAGLTTELAHVKRDQAYTIPGTFLRVHNTYKPFRQCSKLDVIVTSTGARVGGSDTCTSDFHCLNSKVQALRAFAIMAIIFVALLCVPLGILDGLGKIVEPTARLLLLGAAVWVSMLICVAWPIAFSFWTNDCPGQAMKDVTGSDFGPSAILLVISFVFAAAMIPIALVMPGTSDQSKSNQPTVPAEPVAQDEAAVAPQPGENPPYAA